MASRHLYIGGLLCLCLISVSVLAQGCDKSQYKGPIKFYEDLNCTPIYEGGHRPTRYNCPNLYNRSKDKCYANGQEYKIGAKLKDKKALYGCDSECTCIKNEADKVARFNCTLPECASIKPQPNAVLQPKEKTIQDQVCAFDALKCPVGKVADICWPETYVSSDEKTSDTICECRKYTGLGVRFCHGKVPCLSDFLNAEDIYNGCVPLYDYTQDTVGGCPKWFKCPHKTDTVIAASEGGNNAVPEEKKCKVGNKSFPVGYKLRGIYDLGKSKQCFECTCQTPPVPTCRLLQGYRGRECTSH